MILVVGSTGMLGTEICRLLKARHEPVRALVRATSSPGRVDALRQMGVEVLVGDLCSPAALNTACRGVDVVISTASSMPAAYLAGRNDIHRVDLAGTEALVAAAKTNRVEQFIYTSFSGNIDGDFPLCTAKRTIEQALHDSGLVYTLLRPSYFMEVWLTPAVGFDPPNATARIYGTGEPPISWISVADVAAFAAAAVDNPAARYTTLELGGPEPLSPNEVVAKFETAVGHAFEVTHIPVEALEQQREAAIDGMQRSFAGLMACYARGDCIPGMSEKYRHFAVHPTPLDEFVHRTALTPAHA